MSGGEAGRPPKSAGAAEEKPPRPRLERVRRGEKAKAEQPIDCHDFRAMISTTLERMALVCDFCASDIPPRQTYWHCTTCHHTHEFERDGGCDICAACYLGSLHKTKGPLPTKELLNRRGALTLGPSPDVPGQRPATAGAMSFAQRQRGARDLRRRQLGTAYEAAGGAGAGGGAGAEGRGQG